MEEIAVIVEKTLKKLPQAKKIKEQMLLDVWPSVVGEAVAMRSCPLYIEQGQMLVLVQDSVWAQHLSMQRKKIVSALNNRVKTNILKDLRFQADGRVIQHNRIVGLLPETGHWQDGQVEPEERAVLKQMIADAVLTDDLQEVLLAYFIKQKKKKNWLFSKGFIPCKRCGSPLLPQSEEGSLKICYCCLDDQDHLKNKTEKM
jgi:hypothetical protein